MTTTEVDNWPGDVHGLLGPDLMDRMRRHAERFGVEVVLGPRDEGRSRPPAVPPRSPRTANTPAMRSSSRPAPRRVTSASNRRPLSAGAASPPARPATASSTATSEVAVVGGGNTAVEEAIYLTNIASHVTLDPSPRQAARGSHPAGPPARRWRTRARCRCVWDHEVDEVLGNDQGVTGVRLRAVARRRQARTRRHRALHRDRPHAEYRTVPGPARHEGRLHHGQDRARAAMRPRRACRACSRRATSPITSIARPSPPPAPAAWRRSTPIVTSSALATG